MDEHVPGPITKGLRDRGVDVLTVQDDSRIGDDDEQLLDRADELGRLVVTYDHDFFQVAAERQTASTRFPGVFVATSKLSYRQCIDDLELVAKCSSPDEWLGLLTRLPLGM
jgi:predicted nuclease of predicted toxin-antitoxin system